MNRFLDILVQPNRMHLVVVLLLVAGCVSSRSTSYWRFRPKAGETWSGEANVRMLDLWAAYNELTGTLEMWNSRGKKVVEIPYKDGNEHGKSKSWHDNGQLASETLFSNGKRDGLMQVWWPDGTLVEEIEYKDGLRHGKYIEWNDGGTKICEGSYANDKREGVWFWFWPNGDKAAKEVWEAGVRIKSKKLKKDTSEFNNWMGRPLTGIEGPSAKPEDSD